MSHYDLSLRNLKRKIENSKLPAMIFPIDKRRKGTEEMEAAKPIVEIISKAVTPYFNVWNGIKREDAAYKWPLYLKRKKSRTSQSKCCCCFDVSSFFTEARRMDDYLPPPESVRVFRRVMEIRGKHGFGLARNQTRVSDDLEDKYVLSFIESAWGGFTYGEEVSLENILKYTVNFFWDFIKERKLTDNIIITLIVGMESSIIYNFNVIRFLKRFIVSLYRKFSKNEILNKLYVTLYLLWEKSKLK